MEQLVTIELFGQTYTFKAESDVSKAKEVADLLMKEVNRVESQQSNQSSNVTKFAILILAALNIANENVELKLKQTDFLKDISMRSEKLINTLGERIRLNS